MGWEGRERGMQGKANNPSCEVTSNDVIILCDVNSWSAKTYQKTLFVLKPWCPCRYRLCGFRGSYECLCAGRGVSGECKERLTISAVK